MTWFDEPFRSTRDLDLLVYGDSAPEAVLNIFKEVLDQEHPDGVLFDTKTVRINRIRLFNEYGGLRIRSTAHIGGARIVVNVDIGFGDATEPCTEWLDYPILLDMPAPRVLSYARETVIAEKFQAIVNLGMINSRMKDYYDLWMISQTFEVDQSRVAEAIAATFTRRGTAIPEIVPEGLSSNFSEDTVKRQQWESFKRDLKFDPGSLDRVVETLKLFLMPAAAAARDKSDPNSIQR